MPTQDQEQMISFWQWSGYQSCDPLGVPARNGALLYASAKAYVHPAELLLGIADIASSQVSCVAPLRSRGNPLRSAAAIPLRWGITFSLLVMRSMEPHRQVCSTGGESGQFGAWAPPQPAFLDVQKDIPETLPPALIILP